MARVDYDSDRVLDITKGHAAEQDIVVAEGDNPIVLATVADGRVSTEEHLSLLLSFEAAIKLVDKIVGAVDVQLSVKVCYTFARVIKCMPEIFGHDLILKVGLTV